MSIFYRKFWQGESWKGGTYWQHTTTNQHVRRSLFWNVEWARDSTTSLFLIMCFSMRAHYSFDVEKASSPITIHCACTMPIFERRIDGPSTIANWSTDGVLHTIDNLIIILVDVGVVMVNVAFFVEFNVLIIELTLLIAWSILQRCLTKRPILKSK